MNAARITRRTPTEEQSRLMVKVARMYHERGRKQAQIASELHITQARVSRLLRRAADAGIVKTVVSSPAGVHTDLEERLEQCYGLIEAVVVDALSSEERDIAQNLGAAAAVYLESTLLGNEIVGISSSSATLLAAVTFLGRATSPVVTDVVQLVGGVGEPQVQIDANRLLTTFASATGATPIFLPAPGLLGSAAAQHSLMSDPAVQQVSARWSELTTASGRHRRPGTVPAAGPKWQRNRRSRPARRCGVSAPSGTSVSGSSTNRAPSSNPNSTRK